MVGHRRNGPNGRPQLTWANIVITLALAATFAGGGWILFQNQFASQQQQFKDVTAALSAEIKANHEEVDRLRGESIGRNEAIEFRKRIDDRLTEMSARLGLIEATRPTTGELQSIGAGTRDSINEIKDRVRSLEDNLRRPVQPFAAPQQPHAQ